MAKNPGIFETTFDTYGVIGVIGEGGGGRVFQVKGSSSGPFALKCLRPELANSEKRRRFKNEIIFCATKRHPNVIHVLDWGVVGWNGVQTPFYVMHQYSETLRGHIEKKMEPSKALPAFSQLLDGVEAIHLSGARHRDLKPENILYDDKRNLYVVADLGIAHFEEDIIATAVETKKGDKLLNLAYSAPEQRTRGAAVDSRADIYALGQMLNEMFTGSIPEGAGHKTISAVAPEYAYLDELVEKMRQQDPSARPQTIEEIKKILIGRRNEFVALQELDAKKMEVVRTAAPQAVEPVHIIDGDWNRGQLVLVLNRSPEPRWVQQFNDPKYNVSYLMDLPPHAYGFQGDRVNIAVEENYAQTAIDQFKLWSPRASEMLAGDLKGQAEAAERANRLKLQEEVAAADANARVAQKLKY